MRQSAHFKASALLLLLPLAVVPQQTGMSREGMSREGMAREGMLREGDHFVREFSGSAPAARRLRVNAHGPVTVQANTANNITFTVRVSVRARTEAEARGVMQRYTVRLDVKIAPERLVPGLSGEASVILGERADALLVPRRALLGDAVLVVKDGRVERRRVTRGFATLEEAELTAGVAAGELVITENLDAFQAGGRVRVAQP